MNEYDDIRLRFGLRRPNFILDPLSDEDASFFADRTGVSVSDIVENLQIDLATKLPSKRLFWGPYGGGKTHTLCHTMLKLANLSPIRPVYIECPDLSRRSSFIELYRDGIMRACGQDYVIGLFEQAREKVGYAKREDVLRKLKEMVIDEELAKAVAILTDPSEKNKLLLWSWFSGVPVSRGDLAELGQTQDLTSGEPARLAQYITVVGKLTSELQNRTLILVLDEIDRIGFVGPETVVEFRTAFTRLLDPNQKHVSILLGLSAGNFSQLPEIFQSGPIVSRLGADAIMQIPMLDDLDVEPFMRKIISYVRDPQADLGSLLARAATATSEQISQDFFPFTNEAIDAIKVGVGSEMTPREFMLKMTRAAGRAHNEDKPVITADLVS